MSNEQSLVRTDEKKQELLQEQRDREELEKSWDRPAGLLGWLMVVTHKEIAMRYIVTAFCFFLLAGIAAETCHEKDCRQDG